MKTIFTDQKSPMNFSRFHLGFFGEKRLCGLEAGLRGRHEVVENGVDGEVEGRWERIFNLANRVKGWMGRIFPDMSDTPYPPRFDPGKTADQFFHLR